MSWQERLNKSSTFQFITEDELKLLIENTDAYYGSANYQLLGTKVPSLQLKC